MKILSLSKLIISVLLIIGILAGPVSADFQQFLDNTVIQFDAPSSFNSGGEHFVFGGGIHIRTPSMTLQPFSVTPPSFKGGCSGLDMTFGAFRYLDVDKFVKFVKQIMSNAPGFAFQLGMDVLCPKCQDLMNKLSALANQINSLQFDSCKMLQAGKDILASRLRGKSNEGQNKGWMDAVEGTLNSATEQVNAIVEYLNSYGQGSIEHWISTTQRTILQEALHEINYLDGDEGLRAILTAVFGDLAINRSAGTNGGDPIYKAVFLSPIAGKDLLNDFFFNCRPNSNQNNSNQNNSNQNGTIQLGTDQYADIKILKMSGNCTEYNCTWTPQNATGSTVRICKKVKDLVSHLFQAYASRTALNTDDHKIIYALPLPTVRFLNIASAYPELLNSEAFRDAVADYITARLAMVVIGSIRATILSKLSFSIKNNNKDLYGDIAEARDALLKQQRDVSTAKISEVIRDASERLERVITNIARMIDVENKLLVELQQKGIWQSYMLSKSLVTGR